MTKREETMNAILRCCDIVANRVGANFRYTDYDYDDTYLNFRKGLYELRIGIIVGEKGGLYRIHRGKPVYTSYLKMTTWLINSVYETFGGAIHE